MIGARSRRSLLAMLLLGVAIASGPQAASAWPACAQRADPIEPSVREAGRSVNGRVITLSLASGAMGNLQTVNVLLPSSYDRSGRTRYPVLYLLHGAGGDNRTYLDDYALEALVGERPWIVVMPDGSGPDAAGQRQNGGYADWFGVEEATADPAYAWESFHIRELVPLIDRSFPTVAGPGGRAIAGISMGGGGAAKYAAEYPGTFGYVGSFSGALYPELPEAQAAQAQNCKFGDPAEQEVVWRDNDPTRLAANLRGVRLFVRSGNGAPGPYDPATTPSDPVAAAVLAQRLLTEYGAGKMAEAFLAATAAVGIPADSELYPGSHSKPYWEREMPEFFAWLDLQLADPVGVKRSFSVRSAHRWFTAWGWTFAVKRAVREFAYVTASKGRRLSITGSGRIAVETPSSFRPGKRYRVHVGGRQLRVRADRDGRLEFRLPLGRSHTEPQTSFEIEPPPGWRTTRVRIGRGQDR
jgi:diacylglycerol O-acyltransferase/trehalose O-mycolyltransferase